MEAPNKIALEEAERLSKHYTTMRDMCTDAIKQVIGYIPDGFSFTLSFKNKAVFEIPITKDNAEFCLGNFMAWHGFYAKKLREVSATVSTAEA